MEKITKLKTYLNSQEIAEFENDTSFFPAIKQTRAFLERINKDGLIKLLESEKSERLTYLITEIENCTKSYVANQSNSLCLALNHYVSQGYDLVFSSIEDFEKRFIDKIEVINHKLEEVSTDIKNRNDTFETFKNDLNNLKGRAEKDVKNIEEQLQSGTKIVSDWSKKVQQENDAQITAKRLKIDQDIRIYKDGVTQQIDTLESDVKQKLNELVIEFNNFKQQQIDEFEAVDKRRKEFIDMYEIGVKYSKDARFDEYSAKEKKAADIFRWLSLSLMVLVVIAIAYLTYQTIQTELTANTNIALAIFSMLSRFLLVFSLMIPAIYASRESSRHRRNSDKYAQMANELKAFEIAIRTEDMKQEIKERIKEEIFKRYFGNIFADNFVDKNISDDMIGVGRVLRPRVKQKEKEGK